MNEHVHPVFREILNAAAHQHQFSEKELIAADLDRAENKDRRQARHEAQARALDLQHLDAMRRAGAL